jgi:hypothetical protein
MTKEEFVEKRRPNVNELERHELALFAWCRNEQERKYPTQFPKETSEDTLSKEFGNFLAWRLAEAISPPEENNGK